MGRNSDPKSAIAKQHTAPDQEETDGQTHFRTPIAALSSAPSATTAASGIPSLESTSSNYDSDPSKDAVFAIVVYHAEPIMYLEDTLNALAAQTSPLTQVTVAVAKDFPDSKQAQKHELISDICANLSAASGIDFRCVHTPEAKNFGQSIQAAITQIALPAADNSWLWLLHTDSAPLPDALAQMIKMGSDSRRIAAVGPKQIFWNAHPDGSYDLLAVGIKATRSARRVPEIIPGERDQGQLDRQDDVLAIGSAGSLIRAAVYHELSGFDPSLGPFGDGLEFSRRLHVAGYRVVVCPAARIRHAQLSLRPELTNLIGHTAIPAGTNLDPDARISAQTAAQSFGSRRFAQIFNALLAAPTILLPLFWIGFVLLSFPRALIRCAWRDFTRARGELHAGLKILGYFPNILAGRKNIAKISRSAAGLRDLEATNRDVRKAKRAHREANIEARKMAGMPDPLTLQAQQSLARYQRRGCYLALFTVLLMTAVLFIPYFASGTLSGGQLAGDSATGIKIWHTAMQSWMHTGDGTTNNLDPLWLCYLPFLLLGAPFGATLGLTVTISLYITPIIGVLGAYLFTGHFTRAWLVRYVLAIFWMLAPGFITALHDGRIGPALLHAVLPFFAWAFLRARAGHSGGIGICAITLALICAAAPIFLPLSAVLTLWMLLRHRRWAWLWLPVPALVLLTPQLIQLRGAAVLSYLFANPGVPMPNFAAPIAVFGGFPDADLSPDLWTIVAFSCFGGLLLSAIFALLRGGALARQVRSGWVIYLFGTIFALATLYLPQTVTSRFSQIQQGSPWHGSFLSVAWLGLLISLAAGTHGLRASLKARNFGFAQILSALAIFLVPVSMCGLFITALAFQFAPEQRVLTADSGEKLPAIAKNQSTSANRSRLLAISAVRDAQNTPDQSTYHAELWRADGIALHEFSMLHNRTENNGKLQNLASADLAQIIADLLVATPDSAARLQEHGVGVVLVPPASAQQLKHIAGITNDPNESKRIDSQQNSATDILLKDDLIQGQDMIQLSTPARDELISALQRVPGLEYVTENEKGVFWRVQPANGHDISARAWITDESGKITAIASREYDLQTEIKLPESGIIQMAERADDHWQASFNGIVLSPTQAANGWAQAWEIPQSAANSVGELRIWHDDPIHKWLFVIQLLIALVSIVVALPLRTKKAGD